MKKTVIILVALFLIPAPLISSEDRNTDNTPSTVSPFSMTNGKLETKPEQDSSTEDVNVSTKSIKLDKKLVDDKNRTDMEEQDQNMCAPKNLFTDLSFMEFKKAIENSFPNSDGCLDPSYWSSDASSIKDAFKGTQKEGESCKIGSMKVTETCQTYAETTIDDVTCNRFTNLVCNLNGVNATCRRGILTPDPNGRTALTNLDENGCSKSYVYTTDLPKELNGLALHRQECSQFPTKPEERCKVFTTSQKYNDIETHTFDHSECLKPTHLYCDPVMEICLCGKGYDEVRFQFNTVDNKCYIRPTFDFIEGYLCALGSEPSIKSVGKVTYNFCKCTENSIFNSSNPDWWTCGHSRAELHVPTKKHEMLIITFGILYFLSVL